MPSSKSSAVAYQLDDVSWFELIGRDALKIFNNVTTAGLAKLDNGDWNESFVTDVRGKTIGHGIVYRMADDRFAFIGSAAQRQSQSPTLVAHLDKYTIREDATPVIKDDDLATWLLDRSGAMRVRTALSIDQTVGMRETQIPKSVAGLDTTITLAKVPWLDANRSGADRDSDGRNSEDWGGDDAAILLVDKADADRVGGWLSGLDIDTALPSHFHSRRIEAGFPWFGIDLDATNLPQELDRDTRSIDFQKGCYLGQETVARLDALGQVQRLWVRCIVTGGRFDVGEKLLDIAADTTTNSASKPKPVLRITSVIDLADHDTEDRQRIFREIDSIKGVDVGDVTQIAWGYARRSHHETGARAKRADSTGIMPDGDPVATVWR